MNNDNVKLRNTEVWTVTSSSFMLRAGDTPLFNSGTVQVYEDSVPAYEEYRHFLELYSRRPDYQVLESTSNKTTFSYSLKKYGWTVYITVVVGEVTVK